MFWILQEPLKPTERCECQEQIELEQTPHNTETGVIQEVKASME